MHLTPPVIPTPLTFQTRDELAYTLWRVTSADVVLLDAFLCRLRTRWLRFITPQPFSAEVVRAEAARMVAGSVGSYVTLMVTESHAKPLLTRQVVPNSVLRNAPGNGCGSVGGMMHVYTGVET
jgi:hypothetical protein